MSAAASSKRSRGGRGGVKALITVGALAATAFGWFLYSQPAPTNSAAVASSGEPLPPSWSDLLAPLPTLVPPGDGAIHQRPQTAQPALRSVSLPAPAPVTITRSSH